MKPVDNLESFLDNLRPEVESEGSFTVALDKARHKLEKYQLENFWQFPLELLAVAVLGGADEFSVVNKNNVVAIGFGGETFSLDCLKSIKDHTHRGSQSRRHQRLAVALNAIQALSPALVEFQSGEDSSRYTWTCRRQEESVASGPRRAILPGFSNCLRLQLQSAWSVRASTQTAPDIRELLKRGLFAPLLLRYNGEELTLPTEKHVAAWERLDPNIALNKTWTGAGPIRWLDSEASENLPPFSAVLFVADQRDCTFGLRPILDGVSYTADRNLLGNRYLHALVCAPSLSTDLSHSKLVVNSEYLRLMSHLRESGHQAILRLTKGLNPRNLPVHWSKVVASTIDYFERQQDEAACQFLAEWSAEQRQLAASRIAKEKEKARKRMDGVKERELQAKISSPKLEDFGIARELERAGRAKEAAQLRENVARSTSRELVKMDAKGAVDFARIMCGVLREHRLSEAWFTALESFTKLEVKLEPYQHALAKGNIAESISLLQETEDFDVLAECLELLGDKASRREAIHLRLQALEKDPENHFLRYLRLEKIRLRSRGVLSLGHWIKLSLKASWAYHAVSMGGLTNAVSPHLTRMVLGVAEPQEHFETELLDLQKNTPLDESIRKFCETGFLFSYLRYSRELAAREFASRLNLAGQLPLLRARLQTELVKLGI